MEINEDDFFNPELQTDSGNDNTRRVIECFNKWQRLQEVADNLKNELEAANAEINKIRTETMPTLLAEMGTELWRDPETGLTVELETAVNSSLPKDQEKRNAVLDALRPIGIEEILAEEFNITFTPNDKRAYFIREILGLSQDDALLEDAPEEAPRLTNRQRALIEDLRKELELTDLPAEEKLGVHPSRLKAWLKRRIEAGKGKEILDAGIWHGKHAKVVTPKKGK